MELDPTYDRPYNNLGNLYYNNNRMEDAKKLYIKTLEINPKSDCAYNGLGLCYTSENNYE
jgi:tetratricopeptide (TPR) repeat protein